MRFSKEIPFAPYFIFIKGITDKSDQEVLAMLGLCDYRKSSPPKNSQDKNCIYISRDSNWVHLMDNWYYSHWHSKELANRIEKLGKELEIFTCSVGDSDMSFDFRLFKKGQKVREYIVESPHFNDEVIKVDFGTPLDSEKGALLREDQFEKIILIAQQLGIELPITQDAILCYQQKQPGLWQKFFGRK